MGLPEIYEKLFGKSAAAPAAEKKADGEEQAAEAKAEETAAEATETQAEETSELSDEQIDQALSQMSDEELGQLAKEVAAGAKESAAKDEKAEEKLAEEYFAAGRIFAQGFMSEVNGTKTAAPTATQKFAAMLEKELQAK